MIDGLRLTPARARALIDELEDRLAAAGVRATIRIAGGAAMALRFPDDPDLRVTMDVDAVYAPRADVDGVIADMAREHGLPGEWMNSAGAAWNIVNDTGATISVATPEELIAMKMAAGRPQDLVDLRILADHLGITDPRRLVELAYAGYGDDSAALSDPRESYELFARDVLRPRRGR